MSPAGATVDSLSFLLEDEEMKQVLEISPRSGARGVPPTKQEWHKCQNPADAWACVHEVVGSRVLRFLARPAFTPCRVLRTWILYSPLGATLAKDFFVTRKMRAFLFILENTGAIAVVSFFFVATGSVQGRRKKVIDASCGDEDLQEDFAYLIGRDVAVAIGSLILSGLPVSFLNACNTRGMRLMEYKGSPEWKRQLHTWRRQDALIYFLGTLYLLFVNFFILVFLANMADEDTDEWMRTTLLTFFWDFVALPFALAIIKPLAADVLSCFSYIAQGNDRPTAAVSIEQYLLSNTNLIMLEKLSI